MPSGGARSVSGPPPDPNALRRARPSDAASWTTFPGDGRPGKAPQWSIPDPQQRELELWDELWAKPQAVAWEKLGQELEVAMFVRQFCRAEQHMASVELQKVVRQYLDSLGLSVQGMLRNRWRIAPTADAVAAEVAAAPPVPVRRSAKSRLRSVPDGEGA